MRFFFKKEFKSNQIINKAFQAFLLKILGSFLSYLFTFVVAKFGGAKVWGIFSLSLVLLQILSSFSKLGLDIAIIKFIAQFNALGKYELSKIIFYKAFKLVLITSFIISIIVYWSSSFIAIKFLGKEYFVSILEMISFAIIPYSLLGLFTESLRAFTKIIEYIFFQNVLPFIIALVTIIIIYFYLQSFKDSLVFFSYLLGISISSIISFFILRKNLENKYCQKADFPIKELVRVSTPMLFSSISAVLLTWIDTIMLSVWKSPTEVGIYNIAVKYTMLVTIIQFSVNSIIAPKLAEAWAEKNIKKLATLVHQSTLLIFSSSAPILLAYLLFPKFFMGLIGNDFEKGALALCFLSIGQLVNVSIIPVMSLLFQMTKYEKVQFILQIVYMFLNIFLNFLLIPYYGMFGAAFASMLTYIVGKITSLYIVYKLFGSYLIYIPFFKRRI